MSRLAGKVAVVTGGTGGIGKGVALRLAGEGADVVVNGRSEVKAATVLKEIESLGANGHFVAGDVRSQHDTDHLMAEAVRYFGGVDIVISSAGGNDEVGRSRTVRGPFAEIDLGQVSALIGETIAAKLLVVQSAVRPLRQRGGGSVVFVTSEGGRVPTPGQTAVSASAGGLIQISKLLSKELAGDQIRVNCVCVTLVRDSPSWAAVFEQPGGVSEHHRRQYQKILDRSPFGVAAPGDIGNVIAFLVSDDAHYLTGAVLSPTGGLTLH